uniref:Uncharacterized protein n=1 Tax=viral metagenome TaxID=1070528 RepID=A0A6M3KTC7_9ZZZZ
MGSSGSGGGGGSGRVDYPDYMKTVHGDWLDQGATDTIEASVTEIMNAAIGASPFITAVAYNPATPLADAWTAVCAFNTLTDALDHEVDWLSAIAAARSEYDDNVVDTTQIDDDVNAFAQVLEDQLDYIVLPKLKAGYRDANAVLTSAFPIAEAIVRGMGMRDVAKYATDLRLKNHFLRAEWIGKAADRMLINLIERVRFEEAVARVSVEAKRIHIVSSKEQTDQDYAFDEADGKWDLEAFQYGANVLAAIGGGTAQTGRERPSKAQSALGGAMSGAAAGASIGGAPGAAIGGILGLGAALL